MVHAEARGRGGREIVNYAAQAIYEGVLSEVEEQAHALVHKPKVCQELFSVNRGTPFD